jgi:predicted enzyme related to lactoylglutathione lyase
LNVAARLDRIDGAIALTDRQGAFAWYELLTTEVAAAQQFYGRVVGWQAQDASTAAFPYTVFSAGSTEVGGLMQLPLDAVRTGAMPRWFGYIAVDDVDDRVERLKRRGGSVFLVPTDTNIGRICIVTDPQTAIFGMVGGLRRGADTAEPVEPGHVAWHELFAADGNKAFAFYSELFGWQPAARENDRLESYQLISTGGRTIGGMFTKLPRAPAPFWLYYFEVPDIAVAVARVREGGGRVVQGPMELLGGSWIARCIDPQGAMFSLQGRTSDTRIEPASTGELSWAADWGGFASRGKVVASEPAKATAKGNVKAATRPKRS